MATSKYLKCLLAPILDETKLPGPFENCTKPLKKEWAQEDEKLRQSIYAQVASFSALELCASLLDVDHVRDFDSLNDAYTHMSLVKRAITASLSLQEPTLSAQLKKLEERRRGAREAILSTISTESVKTPLIKGDTFSEGLFSENSKEEAVRAARQAKVDGVWKIAAKKFAPPSKRGGLKQ